MPRTLKPLKSPLFGSGGFWAFWPYSGYFVVAGGVFLSTSLVSVDRRKLSMFSHWAGG